MNGNAAGHPRTLYVGGGAWAWNTEVASRFGTLKGHQGSYTEGATAPGTLNGSQDPVHGGGLWPWNTDGVSGPATLKGPLGSVH